MRDLLFWLGVVAAIVMVIYFLSQEAHADEIDIIEDNIRNSTLKINQLEIQISAQKIIMSDADKALKEAQENLRKVKKTEGKSWDFLPNIKAANDLLSESVQKKEQSRKDYFDFLTQKSNEIKKIKEWRKLILQLPPPPSNVTVGTGKIVLIEISNKCMTMIKNGYNTTCPSYSNLRKFDSSDEKISGKFKVVNGFLERQEPPLKESWQQYKHDKLDRVIIDPPLGMSSRYPLIVIESNFDTFLQVQSMTQKQEYVMLNQTRLPDAWGRSGNYTELVRTINIPVADNAGSRTYFKDVFVERCHDAIINADKWQILLPLVIDHLNNGCISNLDNTYQVMQNYTIHDISTTGKWKLDQWKQQISRELKIGNDNTVNPSVTEDKMPKYKPKVKEPFDYSAYR